MTIVCLAATGINYQKNLMIELKNIKIYPKIIVNENKEQPNDKFTPLYTNAKNIRIVQDAMFGSTNEVMGTSYRSRIDDPKYQFAGKTGTSQVKRITEEVLSSSEYVDDFYPDHTFGVTIGKLRY